MKFSDYINSFNASIYYHFINTFEKTNNEQIVLMDEIDKRVDEQAEPLFFIGSAPVTAPLLMIIGGIILLIIVAVIIKKSFFPSYSCNRSKYSWKY